MHDFLDSYEKLHSLKVNEHGTKVRKCFWNQCTFSVVTSAEAALIAVIWVKDSVVC